MVHSYNRYLIQSENWFITTGIWNDILTLDLVLLIFSFIYITNYQTTNMKNSIKRLFETERSYYLAGFLISFLVYFPAFFGDFAMHNDYYRWMFPVKGLYPETFVLLGEGRPIGALLLNLQFYLIPRNIDAFKIARLIAFGLNLINGYLIFNLIKRISRLSNFWIFTITTGYLILPANIINITWVSNTAPGVMAPMFAIISIYLFNTSKESVFSKYLVSSGFYFLSLWTYPPASMIVFSFLLIKFSFPDKDSTEDHTAKIFKETVFFVILTFLFFIFTFQLMVPYLLDHYRVVSDAMAQQRQASGDHYEFSLNRLYALRDKFIFLNQLILYFTYNTVLSFNPIMNLVKSALTGLFFIGLIASIYSLKGIELKKHLSFQKIRRFLLGIVLFFLVYAPFVAGGGNSIELLGFRVVLGIEFANIIVLVFLIRHIYKTINSDRYNFFIGLFLGLFALNSLFTIFFYSENLRAENQLARKLFTSEENPCDFQSWTMKPTFTPHIPSSFPLDFNFNASGIEATVGALVESIRIGNGCTQPATYTYIKNSVSLPGQYVPDTFVVLNSDPNNKILRKYGYMDFNDQPTPESEAKEADGKEPNVIHIIGSTSPNQTHAIHLAMDSNEHDAGSFWEFGIQNRPFVFIKIRLESPDSLDSYKFLSFQKAGRMPTEWTVYGKSENGNWVSLETRSESPWGDADERTFKTKISEKYSEYKFEFTGFEDPKIFRIYEFKPEFKHTYINKLYIYSDAEAFPLN